MQRRRWGATLRCTGFGVHLATSAAEALAEEWSGDTFVAIVGAE